MIWLKPIALLLLTLIAMRAVSWSIAWALARLTPLRPAHRAIIANLCAFSLFLLLVIWSQMPGEELDPAAVGFGVAVFAVYALIDLYRQRRRTPPPA